MRKRRLLALTLLAVLALALAQETTPPTPLNLDFVVRLSIVEGRVTRLESDYAKLDRVPEQLARMESTLEAVAEKTKSQGGIFQQLGVGVTMALVSSVIAFQAGKKSK